MLEHIGKLSDKQVKLCVRMKPLPKSKHFIHVVLLCSGVISHFTVQGTGSSRIASGAVALTTRE